MTTASHPSRPAVSDSQANQELTAQKEPRPLSPAAQRALAEAAARRAEIDHQAAAMAKEQFGRKGPEPVRYGDWEVKGLASDF
jgi:hypothetical protein